MFTNGSDESSNGIGNVVADKGSGQVASGTDKNSNDHRGFTSNPVAKPTKDKWSEKEANHVDTTDQSDLKSFKKYLVKTVH